MSPTSLRTNESSQPNKGASSDHGQKFDVFLSHSGKQKNFIRQLRRDLKEQGLSCFFDEDDESLPVGKDFPKRIFEAAERCSLAVLLLSKEFLKTKWPMLELSAFVKARDGNSNLEILPLFFMIPPGDLKQLKALNKEWKKFVKPRKTRIKWGQDLNVIGKIKGLRFSEDDDEVKFRDKIVEEIRQTLTSRPPRYNVPSMQGEVRMCEKVAKFFDNVKPNEKRIRIAGLYGIAGDGKTTLGKAFCNFKFGGFKGKVCHLDFSRGDSFERMKFALQHLTHCRESLLQRLTASQDQAQAELYKRVKGQRVLLVLDDIREKSIDEVRSYVDADFSRDSWILLCARSVDFLVNHFQIDSESCMRVPGLENNEAIRILLERTSLQESTLGAEDRDHAWECAKKCSFKETCCDDPRARRFHPLHLKALGVDLFSKYGSNLSKWVAEIDRAGEGLHGVLAVQGKAFDNMPPKYRTIFMLLTVYMPPNMSSLKVNNWLAINCNEDISFIKKAVEDLHKEAFIEEFKPEIRVHDLYIEFAQSKANEMGRWLWWKENDDQRSTRGLIPQDNAGFELAKLEQCMYRRIAPQYLRNLFVLQLVDVQTVSKLDLGPMVSLRSITLRDCKVLAALDGMENLLYLAWLQIIRVNPMFKLPELSSLQGLQHLEIDIASNQVLDQLGDLTHCFRLREINVRCPSLSEFPRLNGLLQLEKVECSLCDKVKGVLNLCCPMASPPLLGGCKKLFELVLLERDAVTACPGIDVSSALKTLELSISSESASASKNLEPCCGLKSLQLWNMAELKELPSFRHLSYLTVLKLDMCGIREPPDLTCCFKLEDVHFFTLKNLQRFPNFSSLRELKKLSLCNCISVQDPPDIEGCRQLQVFHLLYNDNMKGLPKMDKCRQLEEFKVSWHCEDEVTYEGIDPDRCQVDEDLEYCLDYWKDVIVENLNDVSVPVELKEWMQGKSILAKKLQSKSMLAKKLQGKSMLAKKLQGKSMLAKKYFRGVKLFYSVTAPAPAPYESYIRSKRYSRSCITLRLIDRKVIAFSVPTLVREDRGWLNRVREYFDEREDIVRASAASACKKVDVSLLLPHPPWYHVKMWKTTRAEVSHMDPPCFEWGNVDHKVCDLDICGGNALARQKLALLYLSQLPKPQLEWVISEDEAHYFSNTIVEGQKAVLVLNNITEPSRDEVRYYLGVVSGKNSCIHLNPRSVDQNNCNVYSLSHENEEAIAISLGETSLEELALGAENRGFAWKRANRGWFKQDGGFDDMDPLALKAFGRRFLSQYLSNLSKLSADGMDMIALKVFARHVFSKYRSNLLKWVAEIDGVDDVFAVLCWLKITNIPEEIEEELSADKVVEKLAETWKKITNIMEELSSDEVGDRLLGKMWREVKRIRLIRAEWSDHGMTRLVQMQESIEKELLSDEDLAKMWKEFTEIKKELFSDEVVKQQAKKWKEEINHIKSKLSSDNIVKGLTINCNEEIKYIKEALEDLCKNAFIEEFEPANRIDDLIKEFAQIKRKMFEAAASVSMVEAISLLLPLSPRYPIRPMQGEVRMCQEVADFFKTVHPDKKGIRIVGLYGMPGQGKTTLAKAFCNLNLRNFDGKVCHLEFCGGNKLERQKLALRYLTQFPIPHLESVTNEDDAHYFFNTLVKGQRVLLVLDDVTDENVEEVKYYLGIDFVKNSCILLNTRTVDVVVKDLNIDRQSCMHVPWLTEEEAIAILLERTPIVASCLQAESRDFALKCAKKCSFKEDTGFAPFHPLALKAFGRHLFCKQSKHLSKWAAEIDGFADGGGDGSDDVFAVLDKAFHGMDSKCRNIFMLLTRHRPPNMSSSEVFGWLAISCNQEIENIKEAVGDLRESAFIEETEPEIRIHDLLKEFAEMNNKNQHDKLEMLGKYVPMDQTETSQLKKLSSEEYSQAHSTRETSQANRPTSSDQGRKGFPKDVFLSHSGKQKIIVRRLYRELTNQGVSCFFDQDPESLPLTEKFPPRIFEAVQTCKVALLLLSKDFLESKWPMQELSAFVEARDTNPNLKILPLFFLISPDALKNITELKEKWKQLEISSEERVKWEGTLRVIQGINGLPFKEGDDEDEFRENIVKEIWHILATSSRRYHIPCMQGEERMCKQVADFFNKVQPDEKGIRIAGLYGIPGHGKTTLCKAFCNFKLGDFEGRVCHLEFSRGESFEKIKLALQHLTHCPQSRLQTLTSQDQAQIELYTRLKGQRVLLVLDNVTEESIDEVRDYVREDLGESSCILLSARSVGVLVKHFNIDSQSCMRVPSLEKEEAIAILLGGTSLGESTLGVEDRDFALKCANRCLFKETSCDIGLRAPTFHPLALKAFGGYLRSKCGSNLSTWVAEINGMADRASDGFDEVFALLGKAFDEMPAEYRTIFMLLTVYRLPNMSSHKVTEWLGINCNKEIWFIKKAVEGLCKKAFIEEFESEIRIHDLYVEFAQKKADEMGRWLSWKGDKDTRQIISGDKSGFELAKLEQCMYRRQPQIAAKRNFENLLVLQLEGVQKMSMLDFSQMGQLRSITLHNCEDLAALEGMKNLPELSWLQISGVNPMFTLPELSSLEGLQYLEINIARSQVLDHLGDLTHLFRLREINVNCRSLLEFPKLNDLPHLEKVKFSVCDKVKGPLDCRECVELQSIVFNSCCQMTASPLLAGCKKLSKIVMWECDAVTACPDIDVPSALKTLEFFISSKAASAPKSLKYCYGLENLQLWNMGELKELPTFKSLSNLTVLKLGKCGIREPPDLTGCVKLEDICFFTLKNLERFPNFSSLRELKKLSLCDCISVQDPPDIEGCHELQVFHLLYNDNMKGLSKMDKCEQLEEIKVSWHCKDEVTYEGIDPDSCQVDEDLESCLEYWKDVNLESLNDVSVPVELEEWMQGKSMLAKKYFRGGKLYYSVTAPAPYEPYKSSKRYSQSSVALRLVDSKVIAFRVPTVGRVCKDRDWLNKVREYFDGREDIARASAASACKKVDFSDPLPPSPWYHVKTWKTTSAEVSHSLESRYVGSCYLDFCGGNALLRQKLAVLYLTQLLKPGLEWVISEEEAHYFSNTIVAGKNALLVLNYSTEYSRDKVTFAESGENSCFYLEGPIDRSSSSRPITISLERTHANSCWFEEGAGFHDMDSLAWKAFGRRFVSDYLSQLLKSAGENTSIDTGLISLKVFARSKYRSDLLKWVAEIDGVDDVFAVLCWLKILEKKDQKWSEKTMEELSSVVVVYGRILEMQEEVRYIEERYSMQILTWKFNTELSNMREELSNMREELPSDEVVERVAKLEKELSNTRKEFNSHKVVERVAKLEKELSNIKEELLSDEVIGWEARKWKKQIDHIKSKLSSDKIFKALAINCNKEIKSIKEALEDLCKNAFIGEFEPANRIDDLIEIEKKRYEEATASFNTVNTVEAISFLLLLSPRYRVPPMQGEERMCQEVADFFSTVRPNGKGIRIAGLYGMPGQGKTTITKAFCNLNLTNFDGKVCFLEFCGCNKLERQKLVLRYLTQFPMRHLESVTNKHDAYYFFNKFLKGQRVLLVLDNITGENIDEVNYYLGRDLGENSCVLLSTRYVDVLVKDFNIDRQSCMHVPRLTEEEAIAILFVNTNIMPNQLEDRGFALKCAKKCSFKEDKGFAAFHPVALKAFGRYVFRKESWYISQWTAERDDFPDEADNLFDVLDKAFEGLDSKYRTIFMHLAKHMPPNMSSNEAFEWLAKSCNEEIEYIKKTVEDLCKSAFVEEIEPEIRIHNLLKEFARMENKNIYDKMGEAKSRDIIVRAISCSLPQRYHVPAMHGGTRMCQKLADFFNTVHPNGKGIRIAGLYGMPGQGKTALGKTFCNLNLENFGGRVCHLEFCGGNKLDRQRLALQYLTNCSESQLESLTREDEAQKKLYERVRGKRVLLVLDNITEESIDEVKYYLGTGLGEKSCILLSARSEDVLAKNFSINLNARISVPDLEEKEAIAILLETTSLAESALGPQNRGFALQCANKFSFKETSRDIVGAAPTFHPLALKTFGRHLFCKYGSDLSHWVAEVDGLVLGSGDGLDDVFIVLEKAFDYMDPKYRTIFMLLTLYMRPKMSPFEVKEWLAITYKEEIEYIEKAVEDLWQKAFIEEIEPEIRIHNLFMELALSKAKKMERWLWCKGDLVTSEGEAGLFSKGEAGFELTKLQYCQHLDLSLIGDKCVRNLWALQVVDGNKEMSNLGISLMKYVRSVNSHNCEYLIVLGGKENLPYLASLQVGKAPDLKVLNLSSLKALQYLEIDIGYSGEPTELGDLTGCVSLREIYVCCRSLLEFPRINGLPCLEKASFKGCDEVIGPLDCSKCVKLRSIVFEHCSQMAHIPLIVDCSNLSKIVLNRCDPVTEYSDKDESSALEILKLCISSEDASAPRHPECCDGLKNLPLWNIVISSDVPSLRRLSNLTVLKLYKCDINEPPDVTCCSMLEDVYFFTLKYLKSFPNFSSLRKLKKLCLCNCKRVGAPPDIGGCHGLQVFHLLYNDNMEELPKMDGCPLLEEIKMSWHLSEEAVDARQDSLESESCSDDSHSDEDEDDDLEFCPDYQKEEIVPNLNDIFMPVELKEWQWIQGKTVRVKRYFRREQQYYSITAPYVSYDGSEAWE